MLGKSEFWVGFAIGIVAVYGYHKYTARKAASNG